MKRACVLLATVLSLPLPGTVEAQTGHPLRVGAARVNTTPPADAALPLSGYASRTEGFTAIRDSLHHRILVLDDGQALAAIVVGDLIGTTEEWWQEIASRVEREAGIPRERLLLAATHTHGAPVPLGRVAEPGEALERYTREVADRILQGVLSARAALQPVTLRVGRGRASVNINRTARMGAGGYWIGLNPDGPSDKTVHVLRFDALDGRPIAILVNYAVHGVVYGADNLQVTGDLPGATARLVEQHYGGGVVVPWTSGAAGDQAPIYRAAQQLDQPERMRPLEVQAQILGEEVIRVADSVARPARGSRIVGGQRVVTLPGKQPGGYSPSGELTVVDADSVRVRLSLLMIGPVALAGVSGEVLTRIGQRLKAESPFVETMMITHANGSSGYLADDEAYRTPGYEVVTTRVREGAEDAIVEGLLDLMSEL